ncbi:MAG: retropepsin-like domain-containing protein [Dehalobacter sp.]|nr:retropepsin-like domain-containing protein [Dehalobacter sp.]
MINLKFDEYLKYQHNSPPVPVLQVRFVFNQQHPPFFLPMVVDSGAFCTTLPMSIATGLNLDLSTAQDINFSTPGGNGIGKKIENVRIEISKKIIYGPVMFNPLMDNQPYGLLGREGIFDKIKIAFRESHCKMFLSHTS